MIRRFAIMCTLGIFLSATRPASQKADALMRKEGPGTSQTFHRFELLPDGLEKRTRQILQYRQGVGASGLSEKASRAFAFESKEWTDQLLGDKRTLRVCFYGGNPQLRKDTARVASEWTRHCNLNFDFGQDTPNDDARVHQGNDDFEIHITFRPVGGNLVDSCWSLIGRDAKDVVQSSGEPTMCFPYFDVDRRPSEPEFTQTVLHEFGHALGLEHEHQKHRQNCQLDMNKIADFICGSQDDRKDIIKALRMQYEEINYHDRIFPLAGGSEFDPKSIMNYQLPAEWFSGSDGAACAITKSFQLSDGDKKAVAAMYGAPGKPPQGSSGSNDASVNAMIELLDSDTLAPEVRVVLQRRLRSYAIPTKPGP